MRCCVRSRLSRWCWRCLVLYGVLAYGVAQRTREIGIRMALGAAAGQVLTGVVRQGMLIASLGTVAGLAGALAITRVLKDALCNVGPLDTGVLAVAPAGVTSGGFAGMRDPGAARGADRSGTGLTAGVKRDRPGGLSYRYASPSSRIYAGTSGPSAPPHTNNMAAADCWRSIPDDSLRRRRKWTRAQLRSRSDQSKALAAVSSRITCFGCRALLV